MRLFTLFILQLLAYSTIAQSSFYTKKYTAQELQEDFQIYRNTMETIHPSLYWYTNKSDMDQLMDQTEAALTGPMREFEFFNLIAKITAKINCGHTGALTSAKSRAELNLRFPLAFRYLESKLYLVKDYTSQATPMQVVRSINGVKVSTILDNLASIRGTDGFIQSPNPIIFNNSQEFGYWYHLIYPDSNYQIELENGQVLERKAITAEALQTYINQESSTKPLLASSFLKEESTAVLTINTFDKAAYKKEGIAYKKLVVDFFKMVKASKIQNVVIDLRENGGGEDNYASFLYSYLTDQPFQFYLQMECNPLPYEGVGPGLYLPTEVKNGLIRRFFLTKKGGHFFVKPTFRTKGLRKQKPQKEAFLGEVYFLTSGKTYSASAELSAFAEAYRPKTTFIGQEVAGASQGNTSALFAFLTLKNTRIGHYIPLVQYTMNIENPPVGRGVLPDYPIIPSVKAYLNKQDEALEKAMDLIQGNR